MQKIRTLLALFITLPLILGYAKNNKFYNVMENALEKADTFDSKSNQEKDKILKELDSSILDLNEQIKNYTSGKVFNPDDDIVDLIKQLLEINLYLTKRPCNIFKRCINLKKKIMNDILAVVEDNFGKCSLVIRHLTQLTRDYNMNLLSLTLLIQSIIDNKKYIEKSKIDIIKNVLNCLIGRFNDYFKIIETQFGNKAFMIEFLRINHSENLRKALSKLEGSDFKVED